MDKGNDKITTQLEIMNLIKKINKFAKITKEMYKDEDLNNFTFVLNPFEDSEKDED